MTSSTARAIGDCAGIDFTQVDISHGSHGPTFFGECCVVEWANRAAVCVPELREKFGDPGRFGDDHPSISRVIRSFCISFNDGLPDDESRNRLLRPYITRILGTRTTEADETTRAWLATDWLVRVHAPAWLELAGLTDDASKLRALPALTSAEIALAVQQTISGARERAAAAWAAARAAARDAAWAAARAAA
ncbi:MAG TPA: hypothetical protein VJO33_05040, partial [Gemmatimonadaceae bacterium]|nr:hypothetical protein [Gemmatimonadaceae bacterium]